MNDVELKLQHEITVDDVKDTTPTLNVTDQTGTGDNNTTPLTSISTETPHSLVAGNYKDNNSLDLLQSKCY